MFGKILKVLGGIFLALVVVIGGLVYFGVHITKDSRALATEFVEHLSANEVEPAYALLHTNLRKKYSLSDFREQVERGGLNTIKEVKWSGFEIKDGLEITTGTGETVRGEKLTAAITVTKIENNDTPGILGYDFQPVR